MMGSAPTRRAVARGRNSAEDAPIRLDLLVNPYGPSLHALEMLASDEALQWPATDRILRLRQRLAERLGVASDRLFLANGMDDLLAAVLLRLRGRGPLVLFPPCDPSVARQAAVHGVGVVDVRRGPTFSLGLDARTASDLPDDATALVGSPNDPTGTILGPQEAVRLARSCRLLLIDERHGEYGGRTLLPLASEFDNVLVLRSFESWAGLAGLPFAYAVGPPGVIAELTERGRAGGVATGAAVAALATLDDLPYVDATVRRVREERGRLYRTLRKLNMLRPFPSWGNFVLARFERGEASVFAAELSDRGIVVHRPAHPELNDFVRISATVPEHTDRLKLALVEIAADL